MQNKLKTKEYNKQGFTLVEVILYVSIVATIITTSSVFLVTVVNSRIKNQTVGEVEQQGALILNEILSMVRNADSIIVPTQGTNSTSLTIDALGVINDPIIFSVINGNIFVSEGGATAIPLNNSYIEILNLNFQEVSRAGTLSMVRVSFTANYLNPNGDKRYEHSKTFYGSASIR